MGEAVKSEPEPTDRISEVVLVKKPGRPRKQRQKEVSRARTISIVRLPKREIERERALYEDSGIVRPRTRGECEGGSRPCLFVSCKHHLYLDVSKKTGAIKLNFPDIGAEEMVESCSLDVADKDGATLNEVCDAMNVSSERVRQIELYAIAKVTARAAKELGAWRNDALHLRVIR